MQRDAMSLEALAARDNLMLATWKAARGKRERPAVARYLAKLDARLDALADSIVQQCAPLGRCRRFHIRDPKPRTITAACFADRVLHHAILNLAEPRFERALVASSYACRPGKGVHAAVLHAQRQCQRWPWYVQVDVDGYFPSIEHARLLTLLARRFKGDGFLDLLARIVAAGATDTPGRGLPIGALCSQHFANAYLDAADRWLLARPGTRAHVRYMDDIVWWCESRDEAQAGLAALRTFLWQERGLQLKPAARIARSAQGLAYCGFRIFPGTVLASRRKLDRYRSGTVRLDAALAAGHIDAAQAQRAHDGLLATLTGADTLDFRQRLHARRDNTAAVAYAAAPGGRPT